MKKDHKSSNVHITDGENIEPTLPTKMATIEVAWRQLSYLREEIVEHQKIRAQVIGVKVTAVTLGMGYILNNADKVPPIALIVVAYASVLFDFLIISHSIAIKRAGSYVRDHLEKIISKESNWPDDTPLWEEFMAHKKSRQFFSMISDFGLSVLASILAFASPFMPTLQSSPISTPIINGLLIGLAVVLIIDLSAFLQPFKYYKKETKV